MTASRFHVLDNSAIKKSGLLLVILAAGVALVVIAIGSEPNSDTTSAAVVSDTASSPDPSADSPSPDSATVGVGGMAGDSGPLPALSVDPVAFVRSADNPFRCLRPELPECNPLSDNPMVARSPAEARWMLEQGYPEASLREKVAGWSAATIRQEAQRTGSLSLAILALEREAEEASTPAQVAAVADSVLRWNGERTRTIGMEGSYADVSRARILARAYALAESEEPESGRRWAVDAFESAFSALQWGDTLALEHLRSPIWGGPDEFMSFSGAVASLRTGYQHMRYDAHMRSLGFPARTLSDLKIRPVPIARETQDSAGKMSIRWYGEP